MKQTTKNILGVAAIVLLSSGVAGLTTYKMLNKEKPAAFSELFQQNPNNLLPAAFHATDAQPVDDSYDARRLEENRRKVEDKMSRQGLVPKVY